MDLDEDCWYIVLGHLAKEHQALPSLLTVSKKFFNRTAPWLYRDPNKDDLSEFAMKSLAQLLAVGSGFHSHVCQRIRETIDPWPPVVPTTVNYYDLVGTLSQSCFIPYPITFAERIQFYGSKWAELKVSYPELRDQILNKGGKGGLVGKFSNLKVLTLTANEKRWARMTQEDMDNALMFLSIHQQLYPGQLKQVNVEDQTINWDHYAALNWALQKPTTIRLPSVVKVDFELLPTKGIQTCDAYDIRCSKELGRFLKNCSDLETINLENFEANPFADWLRDEEGGQHQLPVPTKVKSIVISGSYDCLQDSLFVFQHTIKSMEYKPIWMSFEPNRTLNWNYGLPCLESLDLHRITMNLKDLTPEQFPRLVDLRSAASEIPLAPWVFPPTLVRLELNQASTSFDNIVALKGLRKLECLTLCLTPQYPSWGASEEQLAEEASLLFPVVKDFSFPVLKKAVFGFQWIYYFQQHILKIAPLLESLALVGSTQRTIMIDPETFLGREPFDCNRNRDKYENVDDHVLTYPSLHTLHLHDWRFREQTPEIRDASLEFRDLFFLKTEQPTQKDQGEDIQLGSTMMATTTKSSTPIVEIEDDKRTMNQISNKTTTTIFRFPGLKSLSVVLPLEQRYGLALPPILSQALQLPGLENFNVSTAFNHVPFLSTSRSVEEYGLRHLTDEELQRTRPLGRNSEGKCVVNGKYCKM